MARWDESKHKRGQPDNAGQFASNDGAEQSKSDKEKTIEAVRKYSDTPAEDLAAMGLSGRKQSGKKASLSQSEWKRYYDTLGEIKAGTLPEHKTKNGARWVILNTNVESNGTRTPARLIFDNGKYENPKVRTILTFDTDDALYDFLK